MGGGVSKYNIENAKQRQQQDLKIRKQFLPTSPGLEAQVSSWPQANVFEKQGGVSVMQYNMAVDCQGNVLVADPSGNRILLIKNDGTRYHQLNLLTIFLQEL